jgi:protein-L-isoaspartate(D-aspartate) O-methyltransferase
MKMSAMRLLLGALFVLVCCAPAAPAEDPAGARAAMVANIRQIDAATTARPSNRIDAKVLKVIGQVPRHLFVPQAIRGRAYDDTPLPIGYDVTISQPFIVALMTDVLEVEPTHRVLEVGAGSGYQAAVLAPLAGHVYTIEIIEPLANQAAARLKSLGYDNVTVRAGDGYAGWPEHAPFDRIIVTAGATKIPPALIAQLKPGGRLVIPVGPNSARQALMLVTKDAQGRVRQRNVMPVSFVPLQEDGAAAPPQP